MNRGSRKLLRAVLGAAFALSLPVALAGEITLYQQRDFQGEGYTLRRSAVDLEKSAFSDSAASIVVHSGVWEACSAAYYYGTCVRLEPGQYSPLDGSLNSRIASVREVVNAAVAQAPITLAVAEPRIALFARPGFDGGSIELTRTTGKLDRIASYTGAQAVIVYSGTWRLCSDDYYRGGCNDFAPGRYDHLGAFGDHVASAELISANPGPFGMATPPAPSGRVVLHERPHFGGRSLVIDRRELANLDKVGFDNRAASMRIDGGYWMVCTDVQFQGDCQTLGPGEYPRLPQEVDHRIASVRRVDQVYGAAGSAVPG
jgi:hypothetical protein